MLSKEAISDLPFPKRVGDGQDCLSQSVSWVMRLFGQVCEPEAIDQISGRSPGVGTSYVQRLKVVAWLLDNGYTVEELHAPLYEPEPPLSTGPPDEDDKTIERLFLESSSFSWDKYVMTESLFVTRAIRRALRRGAVVIFPVKGKTEGHSLVVAGAFEGDSTSLFDPAYPRLTWPPMSSVIEAFKTEYERRGWPALIVSR